MATPIDLEEGTEENPSGAERTQRRKGHSGRTAEAELKAVSKHFGLDSRNEPIPISASRQVGHL